MKSPLATYKDVIKEFEVSEEINVPPLMRFNYVQEQANEQRAILNRLFFDLAMANYHQAKAEDDITRDAHRQKADNYKGDIRQLLLSVKVNLELLEGLRKEHKELQIEE